MADPKTPSKRTTRSSASSSLSSPPIPSPSPQALTIAPTPVSLETLLSTLPGRHSQILDLLRLLGPLDSPIPPLLLYGAPSTGKTSTFLQTIRHLNRPFIYVSFRSCYSPRILFESVLTQLSFHKKCDRASDFVNLLRDALKAGRRKMVGDGKMVYLVFDNVEIVKSWDKGSSILSLLFKLGDVLNVSDVGFVYISSSTPDGYYLSTGSKEPVTVYFPDYTVEDLNGIFMRGQQNPKLYSAFLRYALDLELIIL